VIAFYLDLEVCFVDHRPSSMRSSSARSRPVG
jgi:hypothetical protein